MEAFDVITDEGDFSFTDTIGHWAEANIHAAASKGLVLGVGGGMFEPDITITREDAAAILARLIEYLNGDFVSDGAVIEYKDADSISGYARKAVDSLSAMGVVEGDGNGYFAPSKNLTRAEAVKLIIAVVNIMP